jgi:hypothetical protein
VVSDVCRAAPRALIQRRRSAGREKAPCPPHSA